MYATNRFGYQKRGRERERERKKKRWMKVNCECGKCDVNKMDCGYPIIGQSYFCKVD
jgi:hypothetical protein